MARSARGQLSGTPVNLAGVEFYSAVAGLLPILALAVVVEMPRDLRALEASVTGVRVTLLVIYLLFFAFAIVAEGLALAVLQAGNASERMESWVETALLAVTAQFVLAMLRPVAVANSHWVFYLVVALVVAAQLVATQAIA